MGKMSRNKGKRSELELVHLLRDFYGYEVRRGDCFRGEADVIGLPGIWIEVKNHQKVDTGSWYWQAWEASKKRSGGIPVVIHKENRKPWLATASSSDFKTLGGEIPNMDDRMRLNVRSEVEKAGCIRYYRQGLDLVTMPLEDFIDIYGGWINDNEICG